MHNTYCHIYVTLLVYCARRVYIEGERRQNLIIQKVLLHLIHAHMSLISGTAEEVEYMLFYYHMQLN